MSATEDRRAKIRARLADATPGPWRHNPGKEWHLDTRNMVLARMGYRVAGGLEFVGAGPDDGRNETTLGVATTGPADEPQAMADAELIAHSPADLTWLLDIVERLTTELAEARATDEAESMDNLGPHPLGTPEFHIWQAGHRAGYKTERRMWQQWTGCKYPQDVAGRFVARETLAERDATITRLTAERDRLPEFIAQKIEALGDKYTGGWVSTCAKVARAALDAEGQEQPELDDATPMTGEAQVSSTDG